jgi:hypothetical protein
MNNIIMVAVVTSDVGAVVKAIFLQNIKLQHGGRTCLYSAFGLMAITNEPLGLDM